MNLPPNVSVMDTSAEVKLYCEHPITGQDANTLATQELEKIPLSQRKKYVAEFESPLRHGGSYYWQHDQERGYVRVELVNIVSALRIVGQTVTLDHSSRSGAAMPNLDRIAAAVKRAKENPQ